MRLEGGGGREMEYGECRPISITHKLTDGHVSIVANLRRASTEAVVRHVRQDG